MTVYPFRDDSIAYSFPGDMCIHHLGLNVYFDEFNFLDSPHVLLREWVIYCNS